MSEILNNLNNDYKKMKKEASSKEQKQQIRQDYKEMKKLIKSSDKLLKEAERDQKKWDKIWDKFDKEYEKIGEPQKTDINAKNKMESQKEIENINQETIKDFDNLIEQIDKKIEELEVAESLEKKDRNDYFTYKKGDIQFGNSQCDFCKYNNSNNLNICIKYPNGKPKKIIDSEVICEYLEIIEKMDNNITLEEAKKIADEKAKEFNKVVVGISENDEYWLFNADNNSHPIDDGAGSCYISKKDGSIRSLNRWDMEFNKKFDENSKKLLVRESLSELYGYHSKNNVIDEKSALEYLNNIIQTLSEYSFKSDEKFVLLGRKKIIYDEINDILNGTKKVDNPIYFVLGSLEEFIRNNNFVYMSDSEYWEKGWDDLRNRNDIYSKNNIICLEEKNVIEKIINKIKDYIDNK